MPSAPAERHTSRPASAGRLGLLHPTEISRREMDQHSCTSPDGLTRRDPCASTRSRSASRRESYLAQISGRKVIRALESAGFAHTSRRAVTRSCGIPTGGSSSCRFTARSPAARWGPSASSGPDRGAAQRAVGLSPPKAVVRAAKSRAVPSVSSDPIRGPRWPHPAQCHGRRS